MSLWCNTPSTLTQPYLGECTADQNVRTRELIPPLLFPNCPLYLAFRCTSSYCNFYLTIWIRCHAVKEPVQCHGCCIMALPNVRIILSIGVMYLNKKDSLTSNMNVFTSSLIYSSLKAFPFSEVSSSKSKNGFRRSWFKENVTEWANNWILQTYFCPHYHPLKWNCRSKLILVVSFLLPIDK